MLMAPLMNDEPERLGFGPFLRELRRALDMDIDEVARRAAFSVDVLRAMEGETVQPTANDLLALARGFGMSTGTMLRLWRGPGLVTLA